MIGDVLRAVGGAVKVAGPAAAGFAAGGPAGAVLGVVGQLAGGAEKRRGKQAERGKAAPPVHKATAPLAAIAAPAGLATVATQVPGLESIMDGLGFLCSSGELTAAGAGALAGVLAALSHQLGHGIQQAAVKR